MPFPQNVILFSLLIFSMLCCSSCGTVSDGLKEIEVGMQQDPGILFSDQFYKQASPEEVRKAINGQSLATAVAEVKYTTRTYSPQGINLYPLTSGSILLSDKITPLSVALKHTPHPEVIRLLLDAGSFLAERNTSLEWTLIAFFGEHPTTESLDIAFPTPLKDPCRSLKTLILNTYSVYGTTPLSLFLQKFPDTDINCQQSTPLYTAIHRHQNEVVLWLIEHGAKLNVTFENGKTPVQVAVMGSDWAVAKILMDHGADSARLSEAEKRHIATYHNKERTDG